MRCDPPRVPSMPAEWAPIPPFGGWGYAESPKPTWNHHDTKLSLENQLQRGWNKTSTLFLTKNHYFSISISFQRIWQYTTDYQTMPCLHPEALRISKVVEVFMVFFFAHLILPQRFDMERQGYARERKDSLSLLAPPYDSWIQQRRGIAGDSRKRRICDQSNKRYRMIQHACDGMSDMWQARMYLIIKDVKGC